jgi:NADH:ubiquinone oxidoreductase subunit F (NADH-binding)
MTPFKPVLLEAVGVPDGHSITSYKSRGGYAPLEKVLAETQPVDVGEMVKASGRRGRGGAGVSTGPLYRGHAPKTVHVPVSPTAAPACSRPSSP